MKKLSFTFLTILLCLNAFLITSEQYSVKPYSHFEEITTGTTRK